MTAYVDAIGRGLPVLDAFTERPVGSQYHANYFQLADPNITGASMGNDADKDVDVNAEREWPGETFIHTTIDNSRDLHRELLQDFDATMTR